MTRIRSIAIGVLIIMSLASCSDADDSFIIGTYDIVSVSLSECGITGALEALGLGEEDCITAGDVEYCHEGVFTLSDNDFTASFEISYLNETISIDSEGSYSFDGDFLELSTSAGSISSSVNPANTELDLLSINYIDEDSGCRVRFVGKKQ